MSCQIKMFRTIVVLEKCLFYTFTSRVKGYLSGVREGGGGVTGLKFGRKNLKRQGTNQRYNSRLGLLESVLVRYYCGTNQDP